MTKAGVLYRLSATRPARCYGRHPTLRRSRAPAFHGSFKNRRLAPSTRGVGIHGDSGTESSETRKSLSRLDSHLPDHGSDEAEHGDVKQAVWARRHQTGAR